MSAGTFEEAKVYEKQILRTVGLSDERADATLRIALGRITTGADVEYAAHEIGESTQTRWSL